MRAQRNLERVAMRESYQRDCLGIWFLCQSDKCSSEYMSQCINNYLQAMRKKVKGISKKEFEMLKKAMQDYLSLPPQDMEGEDARFWQEIVNFQFIFDRPEKCIDLLNDVQKDDFIGQYETLFFSENSKRLDIQLVCDKHAKDQKKLYNENNKKDKMYKDVLKR